VKNDFGNCMDQVPEVPTALNVIGKTSYMHKPNSHQGALHHLGPKDRIN